MSSYPPRPPRTECARPAFANLTGGQNLTCLIRNISGRGACITVINGYLPMDNFELEDKFTRERWRAEVIWRSVGRTGVRLYGVPPSVSRRKSNGFGRRA